MLGTWESQLRRARLSSARISKSQPEIRPPRRVIARERSRRPLPSRRTRSLTPRTRQGAARARVPLRRAHHAPRRVVLSVLVRRRRDSRVRDHLQCRSLDRTGHEPHCSPTTATMKHHAGHERKLHARDAIEDARKRFAPAQRAARSSERCPGCRSLRGRSHSLQGARCGRRRRSGCSSAPARPRA